MQYESEYYGVMELGDTLEHHGVSGMKWHYRRWQNEDGSLTPAGRIHYGVGEARNKARTDEDAKLQRRKEIVDRALHRPDRLPDKGYGVEYARRKFKKMWDYEDPYVAARRQQLREEKGHNPDGSLTERNADKLIKSVAKNGTDASLNYDKFADTEKKRAFTEASDNFAKLRAKTDKLIDDFYKDKKLSEKYLTVEAKKQWNTVSGLKQAWGSFDNYKNFVLKEDGDQGDAVHTWLSDKHADHINKQNAAGKAETKAREAYVAELLGQNANKVYKDLDPNRNISKTMYDPATRTMVKRPKTRTRTYKEILNGALIKRQWSTRTTISRAKAMKSQGMTNKEIADLLGVSPSTVSEYLY